MKRIIEVGFIVALGLSNGCSSDGRSYDDNGPLAKEASVQAIPSRLGDKECDYVVAFNDRSELLLECYSPSRDFAQGSFALWTGGPALQDLREVRKLPAALPLTGLQIASMANDGTVFGTVGDVSEDGSQFFSREGFVAGKDDLRIFPVGIDGASSDGQYFLGYQFIGDEENQGEIGRALYHVDQIVQLAPLPPEVALNGLLLDDVRNDGTVAGSAELGTADHTFSARYGYLHSQKSFELIAPPGRPELSGVYFIRLNNTGSAVIAYGSNTTYSIDYSDGTTGEQQVTSAAFISEDGEAIELAFGDPLIGMYVEGITDREIVYGFYDNQSVPDLAPRGSFLYSPRSGLKRLGEVFPGMTDEAIAAVNNENEMIVETSEGFILVRLPADF